MKLSRKAVLFFAALFVALALAISALQSFWIDRLVIERASERMETLIRAAWGVLEAEQRLQSSFVAFVAREYEAAPASAGDAVLDEHRAALGIDLLVVEPIGEGLVGGLVPGGEAGSGYALVDGQDLLDAGVDPGRLCPEDSATEGLVQFSAHPLRGQNPARHLVLARLLNCADGVVDEIQRVLFEDRLYEGRPVGTATIFLGRQRVATTVLDDAGKRALGTNVSDEVAEQTLLRGQPWTGRAWVVNDWYLSRYEPIRSPRGEIVGMLYIGELERVLLDEKRRALTGLLSILLALVACAGLAGWFASRPQIRQIVQLQQTTTSFAAGDLAARAPALDSSDEIAQLTRSFNAMADDIEREHKRVVEQSERIEQLNRNYLDMLGFVTHEFRSTIGAALFNAQLLEEDGFGELGEDGREGVRLVRNALEHLDSITRNYLQLSQIEAGELVVDRREVRVVRDAVQPVLEGLRAQLGARDMRVEIELDEGLVVPADPTLLRVVYENLVGNASKYGSEGGRIVIGGLESGSKARLFVWNEGGAIDESHRPALFRKFRRYDLDSLSGRKGSGLGLFIVKKIVEGHGGEVWVDSAPGEGTRFTFTLAT